ncbi:MAG: hypothetical protein IKH37_03700 [Prevotella sp.]|nr:hypothetical protein [Prevotella sp.]
MKQIKYSYCLNENNELVHISSVTVDNRHSHTFHCIECGQELIAKIGKIKVPHFAHGVDTACNGESYLHKLAKRRILEKFMSADNFSLNFVRDIPCKNADNCTFYKDYTCVSRGELIKFDLKAVYDTCQEEVRLGEFQPDLLLTNSAKPDREPIFIEVYKTHKSDQRKLDSKYRIIETKRLENEADIDDIVRRGFIESVNCELYNFHPKFPPTTPPIKDMEYEHRYTRFILNKNDTVTVKFVTCEDLNKRFDPEAVRELNIDEYFYQPNQLDSDLCWKGLVYLMKKGLTLRNCFLCKYYKYYKFKEYSICRLKPYLRPKQETAISCPNYLIWNQYLVYPLSELEKEISEVPI